MPAVWTMHLVTGLASLLALMGLVLGIFVSRIEFVQFVGSVNRQIDRLERQVDQLKSSRDSLP